MSVRHSLPKFLLVARLQWLVEGDPANIRLRPDDRAKGNNVLDRYEQLLAEARQFRPL